MSGNPLVATAVDHTSPFAGTLLLEDGVQLADALKSGDWVSGGMAAFSGAVDTVAAVSDPLGTLIAAGLGWLLDHVEPLKGWFNDLTGNAAEVEAFAQTWTNIQTQLQGAGDELLRVLGDVDELAGEAMDAYRRFQSDTAAHLRLAGDWAGGFATGLHVASVIVQAVHDIVRDVLSQLVGSAISWAAEAVFTLGLATPWIIEQVSTRVASLVGRVGKFVTRLLESIKSLRGLLDQLKPLLDKATELFDTLLHGARSTAHSTRESVAALPGVRRLDPRRNKLIDDIDGWTDQAAIPGYKPYGDLSPQEFVDTHLNGFTETGYPDWRWPGDNGFDGPPSPHGLDVGDKIDRIAPGGGDGRFASPSGTPFPDRAIPPDRLSPAFSTTDYTVLKPLPSDVVKGPIAHAFEQPGGGVQYYFPKGIQWYIRNGYLG